ncbi:hypothetical protein [uncultured Roseobacter sp.]|uniref:hypothetical protein n=1 Tax=uncultured Roseobacter sp. TaxID=114847 RepID=UPI00260EBB29|nr:hypothetical protein [uncultured Roseobacter sp.]
MKTDRYSRLVGLLKVLFPLTALALLSTLFLLSRVIDPTDAIPFAESDVQERLLNQQVSGPYYAGTSSNGDQIAFTADKVTSPQGLGKRSLSEDVHVEIKLVSGTVIDVTSDWATVDIAEDLVDLTDDVVITTSHGYVVTSDAMAARVSVLDVTSPDTVRATTPGGGDLEAGSMRLMSPEPDAPAQMLFTNGVKLIYQPKKVDD